MPISLIPRRIAALSGAVLFWTCVACLAGERATDAAGAARDFRKPGQAARAQDENTLICEAEEFAVGESSAWQARNWGENYYAATFANTFLSRKAYLSAPEQCERAAATMSVEVPKAGRYLALVRYEAVYRFETQFTLRIEQNGKTKLNRLYGARDNVKIWARFADEVLQKETAWYWGAVENVVWEGHDAGVDLEAGPATLTLIADKQPEHAARRNVDLVMLTSDVAQVKNRIAKDGYLPLDGMLTQAGDVFLKVHNGPGGAAMTLHVGPCGEHSPYGVHERNWKARDIQVAAGQTTDWIETGSLLDSLNDGQWTLTAKPDAPGGTLHYTLEFGAADAGAKIQTMNRFESRQDTLTLAYDANTRYTRHIRLQDDVLYDLLAWLKAQPVHGKRPERTQIWGYTFAEKPRDAKYTTALDEFIAMYHLRSTDYDPSVGKQPEREYVWFTGTPAEMEQRCLMLQKAGKADKILCATLGDEINPPGAPADDHTGFRTWLQAQGLAPNQVDPAAGGAWEKVLYTPKPEAAKTKPALYYYSMRYSMAASIRTMKATADILRKYLPNAGIGANFSPHDAGYRGYLGPTFWWVTLFRQGGMTMPWSEDYIWQLPMGTQQMNFLSLDLFRAGLKGQAHPRIHQYVMAHWPGNTPASWRRQFYGDLGHGMNIVNLFEFCPVQAANTENHVSLPQMYLEVRKGLYELGTFEDVIQDGRVRPGVAALWFSETADAWNDAHRPFAAGKRTLNIAIHHQQLPVDVFTEEDALAGDLQHYQVLYLADQHVSRAASAKIAHWVASGGQLLATAGAGMFDEFNGPNATLRQTLGVNQTSLEEPADGGVGMEKQDLPFSPVIDTATWNGPAGAMTMPVIDVRSRIAPAGAAVAGTFKDGMPAITVNKSGKGRAVYCAFLPGLSYFKPALPMRPLDRGTTDQSMAHFIPTAFDRGASALIALPAAGVERPVTCSEPLVESSIVQASQGTAVMLVNWSGNPVKGLTVTIRVPELTRKGVSLASGAAVKAAVEDGRLVVKLDLDVADALVLR